MERTRPSNFLKLYQKLLGRVIPWHSNDKIGNVPIVLALGEDGQSFVAFERPSEEEIFVLESDTLQSGTTTYDFSGKPVTDNSTSLKRINAYQEFWHSWRTFHPNTLR